MCGVAGFVLNNRFRHSFPVADFSAALLLEIQNRGEHATGYLSVSTSGKKGKPRLSYHKMAVKAEEFIKLHSVDPNAHTVLLHTRAWTKGDPKDLRNNHPVQFGSCFVVHNGSISNDDDVLTEAGLEKEKRVGEVDSFAIPVALDYHGWGNEADIKNSLHMLQGSFAIAAADPIQKPGKVLLAKGDSSPLHVLATQHGVFWASTKDALVNAWGTTLGTPPHDVTAIRPGELGYSSMITGDYVLVDVTSGRVKTTNGHFDVNRPAWSGGYSYQQYTARQHPWTCWPDAKNCVFSEDCGSCHNGLCECWEGNVNHPRLNAELNFKELCDKHSGFKYHCERHKLPESLLLRAKGITVVRPPTRNGNGTASPSRSSSRSATGGTISTKCFFCESLHPVKDMKKLTTLVEGKDAVYECKTCQGLGARSSRPAGHDPKLRNKIMECMALASEAQEIVDSAVQETSWEFRLSPRLVRYLCYFYPAPTAEATSKEWVTFVGEVKESFRQNVKVVQELRKLEEGDGK